MKQHATSQTANHTTQHTTQHTTRLHALHAQCHYWEGTIAAALYLPVDAQENLVFSVEHIPDVTREILGNAKSLKQVVQAMETWFTEYMQVCIAWASLSACDYIEVAC